MSTALQPRRAERVPIGAEIGLRRSFAHRCPVELIDLSVHGARVDVIERVQPGERLFVSLPGIETIEAAARWNSDFVAGVEFARPLHPAVFEMLCSRMRHGG